jgi:hypothetical protein
MKILKIFIILTIFCISKPYCNAQKAEAKIHFEKVMHDFGSFKEEDGSVSYSFEFENNGWAPLLILKVQSSCGCTTPEWTREPVLPGKKGMVTAIYDPRGRPGKFGKSITVFTNASNKISRLLISGNVSPKPRTFKDDYPVKLGPVRLRSTHLAFFKIANTKTSKTSLPIYNESEEQVKIAFGNIPAYIKLTALPEVLGPGEKGVVNAEYDPVKLNDFGFVLDRINLILNDEESEQIFLAISATIEEDFSTMSQQDLTDAPKIIVENVVHNFGKITEGKKIQFDFNFDNKGKNPLLIRKLKSSCGCTALGPVKDEIPGGESGKVSVTFDSTGKNGSQYHNITLVTNDPKMPVINFKVTGVVEISKQ